MLDSKTFLGAVCAGVLAMPSPGLGRSDGPSESSGAAPAGRKLVKDAIVKAPIEQVWVAWTTSEGMAAFFAPESRIEPAVGGPYELFIKPDAPEGSRGCEGCTVLDLQPMERLSFTWTAPPSVPALRNAGIRTRVNLRFDDLYDGRVHVTLEHVGFGEGDDWDKCLSYFDKAWPFVLGNLKDKIADVPVSESSRAAAAALRSERANHATHSIGDFAWLAGRWEGETSFGRFEQTWSRPEAGMMIGMFRLFQDGRPTLLEFMTLAEHAGGGVEFRFRHFSPSLMALEEKDNPTILRLERVSGAESTFVNPLHGRPRRATIIREGPDAYRARSEIERNGETSIMESHVRRVE